MTAKPHRPHIKIVKDGPYLVSGGVPLSVQTIVANPEGVPCTWCAGETLPTGEHYALCRCGQSKNMPFCDGSHAQVHFDGTETTSLEPFETRVEVVQGPRLRLCDCRALCIGASFCDRAGGIRSLIERSDDLEARLAAIQEACDCPAGRLVVWDDEGNLIEPEFEPSIGLIVDEKGVRGPIWVRGGIPIESADGVLYEVRNRATLCGCGRSANKPFCDGTHRD